MDACGRLWTVVDGCGHSRVLGVILKALGRLLELVGLEGARGLLEALQGLRGAWWELVDICGR